MAASVRIPVLVTAAAKRRIAKISKAAGLSMGEADQVARNENKKARRSGLF